MTVNYYIKCSICECVTRMRSPAGYIQNTPVRIHCGNCNTLMTGVFVSNNQTGRCNFTVGNCKQEMSCTYHFYGEASGEVLCHKICDITKPLKNIPPVLSPTLLAMKNMETEECERYIDYACHISELSSNWDSSRILYDLFLNEKYDLLKEHFLQDAQISGYSLCNEVEIQRYIHYKYLYDFGMIFGNDQLKKYIIKINYEFYHLNKIELNNYITVLVNEDRLKMNQKKIFTIMNNYIKIALYTMPALSALLYKDDKKIDKENYGITTCSFEDIKTFYVDTFEALADCCDIIKCLDNIKYRNNYNDFGTKMTVEKFNYNTKNGNKIKELNKDEFFSDIFNLDADSNQLRNAIGHNNYKYNGFTQILCYTPNAQQPEIISNICLLDVAISCIKLMRSSIILEFITYELFRESYRSTYSDVKLHPLFYKNANSHNHCPCGSGKKYNLCCKKWVKSNRKTYGNCAIPSKTKMTFTREELMNFLRKH